MAAAEARKRVRRPIDVAAATQYLVSDEAS